MLTPGRTSIPNGSNGAQVGGGTAYTDAQVLGFLASGGQETWSFDRLDNFGRPLSDLTPYVIKGTVPEVVYDSTLAATKRQLRIQLLGSAPLTPLSDQIRVHYQLGAPDGGWLDFVMGTFTVNQPARHVTPGMSSLAYTGTDYSQLFLDSPFISSIGLPAGMSYLAAVKLLVSTYGGIMPLSALMSDPFKALPANLGWVVEESRVTALNDVLTAINYGTLWVDEMGYPRADPIPDFNSVQPSYTFDTTAGAAPLMSWDETPDLTRAANILVVFGEDPRRAPVKAIYINDSPLSRVSTVRWHPKVKVIRDSKIGDLPTAYARARVEAQHASRIWSELLIPSMHWPLSQERDVYGLIYSTADEGLVAGRYLELGWTHRCGPGLQDLHRFTRIEATK